MTVLLQELKIYSHVFNNNILEHKYGVQTKVISVDFSKHEIYEDIKMKLEDLDIGILGKELC